MRHSFHEVPISKVRQYWDSRPCNIRHSDCEVGTTDYFNQVELKKYTAEPHIPGFAQFRRWKNRKVLEIGCGIGTDTINFARWDAKVTAVDLSKKSLWITSRRAKVFDIPDDQIRFFCADVERLSSIHWPEKYDLIYSFGVLHHTPNPDRALEELRSYIKPDGELRIMVYHRRSWKALWILLKYGHGKFWRLKELIAEHSEAQTGCPVTYAYTKREIVELLDQHGFRATNLQVEHIFPYEIEAYKRHEYRKVGYFRWMPDWLFQWLEHQIGWHLCVTAVPKGGV